MMATYGRVVRVKRAQACRCRWLMVGQASVETVLLFIGVVFALVAMAVYVQRAYQGYLFSNASSHGLQFDPTQAYHEDQQLKTFHQHQHIEVTSGKEAVAAFAGDSRLPSVPGGVVPAGILGTKANVTTSWEVETNGTYQSHGAQ